MIRLSFVNLFIVLLLLISNNDIEAQINKNMVSANRSIVADTYGTDKNAVQVTVVGHGSLMLEYKGKVIHIDPYSKVTDYSKLPKADLILLTHEHADHLDTAAISLIKQKNTHFIVSKVCNEILKYGQPINNGESKMWKDIQIEAVAAYNIVNMHPDGIAYHPKGRGNGYVLTLGKLKIYIAGDTENVPEMEALNGKIDIAFMPKNLPYTMSDEMFVDAAKKVSPKVLYPYHFNEFNKEKIGEALSKTDIELKVRPMQNK